MDDKYERILKYCEREVERIIKMYKKQKDDPPVPRLFPPIAGNHFKKIILRITCNICFVGRIKWARSLGAHLDELLSNVTTHHVLKNLPAAVELARKHTAALSMLKAYEDDIVALWMNQHVRIVLKCYIFH